MLLADMTIFDLIEANKAVFGTVVAGMIGSIGYAARVGWSQISKWMDRRHKIAEEEAAERGRLARERAIKEGRTLDALTETLPILAEQGKQQTTILAESRKIDSDVASLQRQMNEKFDHNLQHIAEAIRSAACPERRQVADAYLSHIPRVQKRAEEMKASDKPEPQTE